MRLQSCPALHTNRLRLIPAGSDHVSERYAGWLNDPDVVRYTEVRPGGQDLASVGRYVQACLDDPSAVLFAIECDGYGHVGNLRLGGINHRHLRATVALIIGEKTVWGRGLATDAIALASGFAFSDLGLMKLSAGIYATNPASRKAFEKAGYICEATLQKHAWIDGGPVDVWEMARFKND